MKYDIEKLEDDLLALVKSKLSAKLTEITTDKGDGITLAVPTNEQYFCTTDDQVINESLTVMYGVVDGSNISIQSANSESNRYCFLVYLDEINELPGVARKKLHRYIRAFKEIFEENFDSLQCISKMSIESISPTSASWDENENSPIYKVGGVFVNVTIAS